MQQQEVFPKEGIEIDVLFTPEKVGKPYRPIIGPDGLLEVGEGKITIFLTINLKKNPLFSLSQPFSLDMEKETYGMERVGSRQNDELKRFDYSVITERDHPTGPVLIDSYPYNGFRLLNVFEKNGNMQVQVFGIGITNQKGKFYLVSQKVYDSIAYLANNEASIREFTGKQWSGVRKLLTRMITNAGKMKILKKDPPPQALLQPLPKMGFSVRWFSLLSGTGAAVDSKGKNHMIHYNDFIFANGSLVYLNPGDLVTGKIVPHTGFGSFKTKIADVRRLFTK